MSRFVYEISQSIFTTFVSAGPISIVGTFVAFTPNEFLLI